MMYTEKQKDEFKLKFIQTRRYQVALFVPLVGTREVSRQRPEPQPLSQVRGGAQLSVEPNA